MEEVDKIIIHNLRLIGCDLDDDIRSIKQFDADIIVNATVRCLDIVSPGLGLPHSMPPNMAAKYKVGQNIAQACTDLGYKGDIGYQTFLYSVETDIRKILMFLVERLPKEEEKLLREPTGTELLMKRIKCRVKEELGRPWLPLSLASKDTSQQFEAVTDPNQTPAQAWSRFWKDDLFSGAVDSQHLFPTLITLHSRGVLSKYQPHWFTEKNEHVDPKLENFSTGSSNVKRRPALPPKPKIKPVEPSAVEAAAVDEERLQEEKLAVELEEIELELAQLKMKKVQLEDENIQEQKTLEIERGKNLLETKVVELLPDAEENIKGLELAVQLRSDRLVKLAQQWETHRVPLVNKYRECVAANSSKENESAIKAATVRSLIKKRTELEAELQEKEQILGQLQAECERLGREAHRSAYTRRILEIIANVDKQKVEISKMLKDTQDVQKEINTLSGQLGRCFSLADETIFADAVKDETSKRAYKLLATLHSDCEQIVAMIRSTGATLREIRDLQDQVETERNKDVAGHLARITADLSQMQEESNILAKQIRLKSRNNLNPREPS